MGIGTATPSSLLDVVGTTTTAIFKRTVAAAGGKQSAVQFGLKDNSSSAGSGPSILLFADNASAAKSYLGRVSSVWEDSTAGLEKGAMIFSVRGSSADTNAQTEMMRITSAGNVGIGTSTPTSKFTIVPNSFVGSGAVSGTSADTNLTTSTSVTLNVGDYIIPTTSAQARAVTVGGTGTSFTVAPAFSGTIAGEAYTVYPAAMNVNSGKLFVQGSTGNVGIGTTNPTSKLFVNSTGSGFTDITVKSAGPSGYRSGIFVQNWSDNTIAAGSNNTPVFNLEAYRGDGNVTFTPMLANDTIGSIGWRASNTASTGLSNMASIKVLTPDGLNSRMEFGLKQLTAGGGPAVLMSILNSGDVGIGLTSQDERLVVFNGTTTGKYTTTGWTHVSDKRLKHDIFPIENALDKILQLSGVEFKFNEDKSKKTQIGFIAQEVEPVFPEVVLTDKRGFKSMVYSNLVAPIVEAIKTLAERDSEKDRKILALENEIKAFAKENAAIKTYICMKDNQAEFCKKELE